MCSSLVTLPRCRVVVVGGGTGSHTALSGLRHCEVDLTAVVSVMDLYEYSCSARRGGGVLRLTAG